MAISGKHGNLYNGWSRIGGCKGIALNLQANNPKLGYAGEPNHQCSVSGGTKSGTVAFDLVLDINFPQYINLKVGNFLTLTVYEGPYVFAWQIPIRIEKMGETVDINDGGEVVLHFEASCCGAWRYPDGTLSS